MQSSLTENSLQFSTASIFDSDLQFIFNKIANDLPSKLTGETIFLTGATGFIGKWLTQALLAAEDHWNLRNQYVILTRDPAQALKSSPWIDSHPKVKLVSGDIRSLPENLGPFSTIIHGAAAASRDLNENRPEEMFDTILEGTRNILELAEKAKCKRLLFISSGAVYGPQPSSIENVYETYTGGPNPTDPRAAYGEAKRAAELLSCIKARQSGFELKIARCFAFVGPYLPLDIHFAAGNFLASALRNEPIKIGGDGSPLRSYLYAADLTVWLLKILLNGQSLTPYNVGSDAAVSIAELANKIHQAECELDPERLSLDSPIQIAKIKDPNLPTERYVPSIEKARTELGLEVWTPLHEALSRTLQWHKRQPT